MPSSKFVGFVGPSYTLSSVKADAQRCVNLYPEMDELGTGKNQEIARLVSTPGLKLITSAGDGPNRGMYRASNGRVFCVSGTKCYELSGNVAIYRGSVTSSNGQTAMADNGWQLVVVSDGEGWILQFSDNSWTRIVNESFPDANSVDFLDSYIIVNDRNTGNFQFSSLADASEWDGLDLAVAEGSPDNIITLIVDHRQLFLFGEDTTEVWFNCGDAYQPIARVQSGFIEHGIIGPWAKAKLDNGVFFWSKDKNGAAIAMRISGYAPQRVSNHALEEKIKGYGDISQATCWTYQLNGHPFWVTNFPGADVTWVLDIATGLWHERQSADHRNRAQNHCFDGTRHIVGDYENGNIYELDEETYTDHGEYIPRIRRCPHIASGTRRISHYGFILDMEVGVGNTLPPGQDPKAMLRWSDDGGHTWKRERTTRIGKRGKYRTLVNWNRLGASRDRVYELKITDPVPVTLLSAELDLQGLGS